MDQSDVKWTSSLIGTYAFPRLQSKLVFVAKTALIKDESYNVLSKTSQLLETYNGLRYVISWRDRLLKHQERNRKKIWTLLRGDCRNKKIVMVKLLNIYDESCPGLWFSTIFHSSGYILINSLYPHCTKEN